MKQIALCLAGAASIAASYGQTAPRGKGNDTPTISPWQPVNESPIGFAKSAARAMKGLKRTEAHVITRLQLDGRGGQNAVSRIQNSQEFAIEYPFIHYVRTVNHKKDQAIDGAFLVSDGRFVDNKGAQIDRKQTPTGRYRMLDATSVTDWVFGYPKYIFSAVRGEAGIADLVERAMRPGSGCDIAFRGRDVVARGVHYPQREYVITRQAAAAKRLGPLRIEAMFDLHSYVPVGADLFMAEPGRSPVHIEWAAEFIPNQKYDEALFRVQPPKAANAGPNDHRKA